MIGPDGGPSTSVDDFIWSVRVCTWIELAVSFETSAIEQVNTELHAH